MPPARAHLEYTLYIRLAEIEPPIWRRIVVPANLTLHELHQVVQVTMGWTHSHLHQFIVPDTPDSIYYGEPSPEDDYFHTDDRRVRLASIAPKEGATFVYEYDFGDSWRHEITVERITPTPQGELPYPWCLDGQRACPPEDVGGSAAMPTFWKRGGTGVIRSIGRCASGLGSISSRNSFRCHRSTPRWLSSSPCIASHKTVQANVPAHLAYRSRCPTRQC